MGTASSVNSFKGVSSRLLRKEKKIARTLQAGTKKYAVIAALLAQLCLLARAGLSLLTQIRHFWQ